MERNSASAENEYNLMLSAMWAWDNIGHVFHDCTVVDKGKSDAHILTPEGFRLRIPLTDSVFEGKGCKIGQKLDTVTLASATIFPSRVEGIAGFRKQQVMDDDEDCSILSNE